LKVNNDLERIGDLAINIAKRAKYLCAHEPLPMPIKIADIAETVSAMVRSSLDALVNGDTKTAMWVCQIDDQVDDLNKKMFIGLQSLMQKDSKTIPRAINALSASRHLERIADQATNIAEDVIFLVEGEIVRHRMDDLMETVNGAP
jgi:phosphate transport system protein